MDESKKVIRTGILILVLLIAAFAVYYIFFYKKAQESSAAEQSLKSQALSPEEAARKAEGIVSGISVNLDQSDDTVRQLARELSSHLTFALWLKSKDMIRKFTAAVDNIANGESPRPQIDFFAPVEKLKVVRKNGQIYLDPASYERYNIVADVFDSLSAMECAQLYQRLRPLFQQAYKELGYPKEDFHQTLLRSIVEILKAPVVEDPILLGKKVTTYVMVDPRLESLSAVQKHLLRMGPENTQLIQARLRQLALTIGFKESQLPKSITYSPRKRGY
ncbi:MAG: DUF3014 domain-containing protein [Candidatus Aminicenantales bacterium]